MEIINYHVRIVVEESPVHYYREIQTDKINESIVDPSFPETSVRDFAVEQRRPCVPTCEGNVPTDMTIRTNVGTAIVNDDYEVDADLVFTKYIKMAIARDDTSGDLEVYAFEKTIGEYGSLPDGKTLVGDLKEFSVVALGTTLTEEQSFI